MLSARNGLRPNRIGSIQRPIRNQMRIGLFVCPPEKLLSALACALLLVVLIGYLSLYRQVQLLWEVANGLDVSLTHAQHDLAWTIYDEVAKVKHAA